jgi:hypothetical protein
VPVLRTVDVDSVRIAELTTLESYGVRRLAVPNVGVEDTVAAAVGSDTVVLVLLTGVDRLEADAVPAETAVATLCTAVGAIVSLDIAVSVGWPLPATVGPSLAVVETPACWTVPPDTVPDTSESVIA